MAELHRRILATAAAGLQVSAVRDCAEQLADAVDCWRSVNEILGGAGRAQTAAALANATAYLSMAGDILVAWMWLRQALAVPDDEALKRFRRSKLAACRYMLRYELPRASLLGRLLAEGEDTALMLDPDNL